MIVHLNGQLLPAAQARISPLDRGFIFGDAIYEGLRSISTSRSSGKGGAHIVAADRHWARMRSCLVEAGIDFDPSTLTQPSLDLLKANNLTDAFIYWQVTRGTPGPADPPRSRIPPASLRPTVFGICTPQPPLSAFTEPPRKRAVTAEDTRWTLGHIKSTSLLGNVLLTMHGARAGVEETLFLRGKGGDALLAEGTATNVILALPDGSIVTPSLDSVPILAGVTRAILLEEAPDIRARPVRAEELTRAAEIMTIGTTTMVTSIIELDGRPVGDGAPGPVARRLLASLIAAILREAESTSGPRA